MENPSVSRPDRSGEFLPPAARPPPLLSLLLFSMLVFPASLQAATLPPLGTAADFGVLAAGTVTNSGATVVTGDLGVSPGTVVTGFPPGTVTGTTYTGAGSNAGPAQTDALLAYNDASGQACDADLTGIDLGVLTLTPGVYCFDTSAQLTGTLTLDFQNDSNAVFIFRTGSTLTTASGAIVVAINGSPWPRNIIWQIGSSATLGTGTQFMGDILALASITLTSAVSDNGRLYALTGSVTLDANSVAAAGPQCATDAECTDDANICTDEVCNPADPGADAFGCTHPDNAATCDDGLFCNGTDTCLNGSCDHPGDPCVGGGVCGDACNEAVGNCFDLAGTTCRAAAGVCDVAETCTGSSVACPADTFLSSQCRASSGVCDVAETCTGSSAGCPADAFVAGGTICRSAAGECDVAEACTGAAAACPVDGFDPAGTSCSSDSNVCTDDECNGSGGCDHTDNTASCDDGLFCNGTDTCSSGSCDHAGDPCVGGGVCDDACNEAAGNCFDLAGTTCRAATGVCDVAETCTGASAACPVDAFSSTQCRASSDACDAAETCTGSSADCPIDALVAGGTTCRADAGPCDVAEACTGASAACPANGFEPVGTACNTDNDTCTDDTCSSPGTCIHTDNGSCGPQPEACAVSLGKIHSGNDNPLGEIQYTLRWSNACREDLSSVTISDPMPARLLLLSATSSDAIVSVSGNTATFSVPVFRAGTAGRGVINARIDPDAEKGATIRNVAAMTDGAGHSAAAINSFRVRGGSTDRARLSCALRAQVYARPGRYVKYEARYKNGSDHNEITLDMPDQVEIVWAHPEPTLQQGNTLTWSDLALTAGKVTVNTLVSLTAHEGAILPGSVLVDDRAGNIAVCEHVGVVDRYEKLFASIRAQTHSRPGSTIRYTARYREAIGSNQMTVSLPDEVTITRISPAPTGGTDRTLIWTDLPTPSGAVKIDAVVNDVPDGTVLVASVTMTDESADVVGAEQRTVVGSAVSTTGTGSGQLALAVTSLRSVSAGTTTDISVHYDALQAPGSVVLELPQELTAVSAVPAADLAANSVRWTNLTESNGSMRLRVAVGAAAAPGKILVVNASAIDASGATAPAQASMAVRDNSTSPGSADLSIALALARTVSQGVTTDIFVSYDGLQGTGRLTILLPPEMSAQSTVPSGAEIAGRQVTWSGLSDSTGSFRARVLVSNEAVSGSTLSVGATVTDSSGATGSSAATTLVR